MEFLKKPIELCIVNELVKKLDHGEKYSKTKIIKSTGKYSRTFFRGNLWNRLTEAGVFTQNSTLYEFHKDILYDIINSDDMIRRWTHVPILWKRLR